MTLADIKPELAKPILFVEDRFLWIFGIIFAVNWALRSNTARKVWLLVASHCFYGCFFIGNPLVFFPNLFAGNWGSLPVGWWFPTLLWFSTVLDYSVGIGIEAAKTDRGRKLWVVASLCVNLGVLAFFKYYGFFEDNVRAVFSWLGLTPSWEPLKIFLPYGISFYTFQSLSYSIEVYRKHLPAERNFLNLAFFIAFFPQVVAGPIVRAMTFLPQTLKKTEWAKVDVRGCLTMFFIGFVKKACVGDGLAGVTDAYFAAPQDCNAFSAWMAVLCYAGQIYCDFSGYTDMAIAVSRLLGYELCQNFSFPYFSRSITEFWRRWHMSLSSWLRDYLYISLGGNRGSKIFTYRNLMLTMVLGGLWHGASWAFIVWGALHGAALIVHREWSARFGERFAGVMKWVALPLTFYWVLLTWVPFRAADTYADVKNGKPLRNMGDGFYDLSGENKVYDKATLKRDPLTGHWKKKPAETAAGEGAKPGKAPAVKPEASAAEKAGLLAAGAEIRDQEEGVVRENAEGAENAPSASAETESPENWRLKMWEQRLEDSVAVDKMILGDGFGFRRNDLLVQASPQDAEEKDADAPAKQIETPPVRKSEERAADQKVTPADKAAKEKGPAKDKLAADVVVLRLNGSFANTANVWKSLVLFQSNGRRGVVANDILWVLALLGLVHWCNARGFLSTWWRRIPDYAYAVLLGVGVELALFFKPVVFKAFIYFQF